MTNAVFEFSVTVFERHLRLLSKLLETAETYAKNREVEPTLLVFSRLYPDMFTLAEQVRAACNTAKRSTARLAGLRLPESQNTGQSFADLQRRIDDAVTYLETLPESRFAKSEGGKIEFPFGSGVVTVTPQQYLTRFALPNFYFHVTTAYDILRHMGVPIGKRDFLGPMADAPDP
jgi:uncharacterized protein